MKKYILAFALFTTFAINTNFVFAADEKVEYKLLETIGDNKEKTPVNFPQYIQNIYKFALGFVALAALLMISLGGFGYMTAAGNQAQAGTSKKLITDAILGLIIVFVSWLILYTINPDLINAKPGMEGLKVDYRTLSNNQRGKATQRDVQCSNGVTSNCENSKKECEEKNGEGNCNSINNVIKNNDFLGISEDGSITKYDNEAECTAAGESNCVSGQDYKNDIKYGKEEMLSRQELEKESNLKVQFDGRTAHMTEKQKEDLKKFANSFKKDGDIGGLVGVLSVSEDGQRVELGNSVRNDIYNHARDNDELKWGLDGQSWGVDQKGNKYYKITEGENKGYIVIYNPKSTKTSVILPKEDGTEYSREELNIECGNATCQNN